MGNIKEMYCGIISILNTLSVEYKNNNDALFATYDKWQTFGIFDSCHIDYKIDDIIPMDETYSIIIYLNCYILCNILS